MGRIDRINEMMKREIGQMLLADIQDPQLAFVSILKVDVTRDLKYARVYYSFFGNPEMTQQVKERLERLRGMVRKLIGQRIRMRFTPEVIFVYDQSIEYSARIEAALTEIQNEAQRNNANLKKT